MVRHQDAQALLTAAKWLAREVATYDRLSERARNTTDGKQQKRWNDLDFQANAVAKAEAAVHAAAVDAGIADLREPAHYAERTFKFGLKHEHLWLPAQPRALADREAA